MMSHAQRFLVVVVKIAPSVAQSSGECKKISRSAMSAKASNQGVSQSCVLDCYTNSKKFSVEFFFFRWTKNYGERC